MELTSKDFFDFDGLLKESQVIELEKMYKVKESNKELEVGEIVLYDTEFWEANLGLEKMPVWIKNENGYQLVTAIRPEIIDKEDVIEVSKSLNMGVQSISIGLYPEIFKIEKNNLFLENKHVCSCITLNIVKNSISNSFRSPKIHKSRIVIFLGSLYPSFL